MKILITYGSLTGNTQSVALDLHRALVQAEPEHEFEVVNMRGAQGSRNFKVRCGDPRHIHVG